VNNRDICPLCRNKGELFYKDEFYKCSHCLGIFKNRDKLLGVDDEKNRYQLHSDDISSIGYQKFVSPIINGVLANFDSKSSGLDFGSGSSSIVATLLVRHGYDMKKYDPYFYPEINNLETQYSFITACEVIEHFYNPKKEFLLLKSILQTGGRLYCMTHLYDSNIDFGSWYYKNDPTHVFIYQEETVRYIANYFSFSGFKIDGRLIEFYN